MWTTGLTEVTEEHIFVRGYNLLELMESCSFGEVVFLMMSGELPDKHQGKIVEAILVACCDQGVLPPSTNASRFIASCGVPLQAAVAAGVIGFGDHHGGAIENCARMLQENCPQTAHDCSQVATRLIEDHGRSGQRIPGFGHAYLKTDPRAVKLLDLLHQHVRPCPHAQLLSSIQAILVETKSDKLAANINGAVAAALSDLGIGWQMAKGLFLVSRSLGLVAHVAEETSQGTRYKKISPKNVTYTGPAPRRKAQT
jgi:citrate synthase